MNLLSHYYFAKCPLYSPAYCFGLIYPDIKDREGKVVMTEPDVLRGIAEHNALDVFFHELDWFKEAQQAIFVRFPDLPRRNKSVAHCPVAHCAVEIAIDHHLSKDSGTLAESVEDRLASPELGPLLALDHEAAGAVDAIVGNRRLCSYASLYGCVDALARSQRRVSMQSPDGWEYDVMCFAKESVKVGFEELVERLRLFSSHSP